MFQTGPYTSFDNFWSLRRVEYGLRVQDVADLLQLDQKQVGGYFSGWQIPHPLVILRLCILFDVPYAVGEREFQNAFDEYHKHWL